LFIERLNGRERQLYYEGHYFFTTGQTVSLKARCKQMFDSSRIRVINPDIPHIFSVTAVDTKRWRALWAEYVRRGWNMNIKDSLYI